MQTNKVLTVNTEIKKDTGEEKIKKKKSYLAEFC
jgi:hypothetical protein